MRAHARGRSPLSLTHSRGERSILTPGKHGRQRDVGSSWRSAAAQGSNPPLRARTPHRLRKPLCGGSRSRSAGYPGTHAAPEDRAGAGQSMRDERGARAPPEVVLGAELDVGADHGYLNGDQHRQRAHHEAEAEDVVEVALRANAPPSHDALDRPMMAAQLGDRPVHSCHGHCGDTRRTTNPPPWTHDPRQCSLISVT